MIPAPAAAKLLPWRWIALGTALLALLAWGGIGWYGKSQAEFALEQERRMAAEVVSARLVENAAIDLQRQQDAARISDAYQKGKQDVAKAFRPALDDLSVLRSLYCPGGVCRPATHDPGAVPGPADPAGGPHAAACTDRPGDLIAAAHRVAEDLEACAGYLAQLTALQRWVREVQQAR